MTRASAAVAQRLSDALLGPSVRGDRRAFEAAVGRVSFSSGLTPAKVRALWLTEVLVDGIFPGWAAHGAVPDFAELSDDQIATVTFFAAMCAYSPTRNSSRAS